MKTTMQLTQLIAQLQAMADRYPGIECAINDQEWGINLPEVRLQKVYKDDRFEGLNLISKENYDKALATISEYETVNNQDFWDKNPSIQNTYESFGGYEKFAKSRDEVYVHKQQIVKNYQKSKELVIITTN